MTFEFHEKWKDPNTGRTRKHVYLLDGKPVTGVTTILAVLAKPALIGWAARMAVERVRGWDPKMAPNDGLDLWEQMLLEAEKAHVRIKDDAAGKGTDIHEQVENYVRLMIADQDGLATRLNGYENPQIQNFVEWAVSHGVRFLDAEKKVFSETLFVAGTLDLLLEMNGKTYLADVKTSSGIYPEMFYQCAAYRLLLEEMGQPTEGSLIIRLDKKTGVVETAERYDYTTDRDAFLAALVIYRANATYA